MLDFIKNAHKDISNKVNTTYKKHMDNLKSKTGDTPCIPGYKHQECIDKKNKKKLEKINKKNKQIIDTHSKIEKPGSYTKVLNRHYHTGVLNKTNESICNNNLNNASFINKYTYAQKNSKSLTTDSEIDIHGHFIDCSNVCKENFGNFSSNTSIHTQCNNKKIINILLLVLLIICLIPYLYFFIKQFIGKRKKKY